MTISDDFSDNAIAATWLLSGPVAANETGTLTDGILELSTLNGNYDVWNTNAAARAMQTAADTDFTLETRFISQPSKQYQMQGLLVEQDADNWLRFDTYSDGSQLYAFAAITVNGSSSEAIKVAVPGNVAPFLRVERSGDTWTYLYSVDGVDWTEAGTFDHTLTVAQTGVFAGSIGTNSAFTAQVDYFETSDDPIIDEDGNFIPPNQVPVVGDDVIDIDHDTATTFSAADLLANDSDPEGATLIVQSIGTPAQGTLIDNGDNTYTYTPPAGYSGTQDLAYTVTDGGDSVTGTVTLDIAADPDAINALSDDFDEPVLDPLWTLVDADNPDTGLYQNGNDAWLALSAVGAQDSWQNNNSARAMQASDDTDFTLQTRFLSTPTERYQMQGLVVEQDADSWLRFDTFSDGRKLYAFAAVTIDGASTERLRIEVPGGNAPYLEVNRAGDTWTFRISTDGQNWTTVGSFVQAFTVTQTGVFAGNAGNSAQFVAEVDYFDNARAPLADEDPGIIPVNQAPDSVDDAFSAAHDTTITFSADDLLSNDSDPENDMLTITGVSPAAQGTLTDIGDGTYTYTPPAGFSGQETLTYTVSDGVLESTATITITVLRPPGELAGRSDDFANSVLDPVWTFIGPSTAAIDHGQAGPDAYLTITASGDQDIWNTNNGSRVMQESDDIDFTLETRFLSTPTERYQMQGLLVEESASKWLRFDTYSDGNKLYAFAAMNMGVSSAVRIQTEIPAGTAPYIQVIRTGDQWTMQYSVDGQSWITAGSFTQAIAVTQVGVFAGNTGRSASFTAEVDYFETSIDPLTDEDGTVDPGDLPPVANDDMYTLSDGALSVDAANGVLANDVDGDGDGLTLSIVDGPQNGTVTLNDDGSFSYVANVGYTGADAFTYQITDAGGETADARVTLASDYVGPALSDDFASADLGPHWMIAGPATVSVSQGIAAPDGVLIIETPDGTFDAWDGTNTTARAMQMVADTDFQLEARFLSTPVNGFEMQGFFVEQDASNWIRLDVFSDGEKLYAFGAITANNDSTVGFKTEISADNAEYLRATRQDDLWTLETSADGVTWAEAGSFAHELDVARAGLFSGNLDGADGYTAIVDYFENTADPIIDEDATLVIPYSAPVAQDDGLSTLIDSQLVIDPLNDLMANDSDEDGETLSFVSFGPAQFGTLTDNGDGTFTYQPNAGFAGTDSFTYQITDGTTPATATVAIKVQPQSISDDFAGGPLDPAWTFAGIAGSAAVATNADDGFVQIISPAGVQVSASDVMTTPRLMQDQPDVDFEISAGFLTEPSKRYQENGLLVQQDDENWIRFDLAYTGGQLNLIVGVIKDGRTTYPLFDTVPSGQVSDFRIVRDGDDFTFYTSSDGANWTQRFELTHDLQVSQVGVFAGSTSFDGPVPGYVSQVDYFENSATPIINEDGNLIPTNVAPVAFDDTVIVDEAQSTTIVIADLLGNDIDSNGDTLSFAGFGQPASGTVVDNGDGTLTYTPDSGFDGTDSFGYTVSDGPLTDAGQVTVLVGNPIDVWYGDTQAFGNIGQAQEWINVLGNIEGDIAELSYTLNGGASRTLSVGADGRRLQDAGDFNIDIAYAELDGSTTDDLITITALMADGAVATREVVIDFEAGQTWDANYNIDWNTVTDLQDVIQVVDGTWDISNGGVRPVDTGYDRLLVLGDHTWDNYEVSLSVTTHDLTTVAPNGRDGNGFALGMLWGGHTDTPVSGFQPKVGWEPGAAFFYTDNDQDGVGQLNLHPSRDFFDEIAQAPLDLDEGLTYNITMRVEQVNLYDRQYSYRIWEDGTAEPAVWTMQGIQTFGLDDMPATGSLYLNAHYMDVSFNNLNVTEITGRDIVRGLDGDDVLLAVDPSSGLPGLGEVDVFVGDGGADLFVFGDAMGTYYDDGQNGTSGVTDFGYIWDFETGIDSIQLAGSAADYVLGENVAGFETGTAIMLQDGELIGIAGNVYGLDLGTDDFVFADVMA